MPLLRSGRRAPLGGPRETTIPRRSTSPPGPTRPPGPRTPWIWLVSRPCWWRRRTLLPLSMMLPGGSLLLYARYVEPHRFAVRRETLPLRSAPPLFRSSLAHLSDLHLTRDDRWAGRMLAAVHRARVQDHPVGVITGDFAKAGYRRDDVTSVLRRLPRPRQGWFAVPGGWEYACCLSGDEFAPFCEEAGLTPLVNRAVQLRLDGHDVNLAGLDDPEHGDPDLDAVLDQLDPALPTILLCHHPDQLDRVSERPVDLLLAGHSHGGQVSLPGVGPLWRPRGCRRYHDGIHTRADTTLFVSRGLGTTVAPLRLRVRPEIALLRLRGGAA